MNAKQQHQKQRIFSHGKAALLAGALALSLLAGCAADTGAPVVTEDDLTPASAAQEAIQQEAGSGKTYRYFWPAEDLQRAERELRSQLEEQYQEILQQMGGGTEEDRASLDENMQAILESNLENWEAQGRLTPTVSAQEAADLAGRAMEQVYGVDLSVGELTLDLTQIYHGSTSAQAGQPKGMIWTVIGQGQGTNGFSCTINAETAAYENIRYSESDENIAKAEQTPRAGCSYALDGAGEYWVWDVHSPDFEPLLQTMMDEVSIALSGSLLVDGALVTGAEYTPRAGEEEEPSWLIFCIHCDNGRDYYLTDGRLHFYPEYDFDGYPLRGYDFYASDPFNVSD